MAEAAPEKQTFNLAPIKTEGVTITDGLYCWNPGDEGYDEKRRRLDEAKKQGFIDIAAEDEPKTEDDDGS